MRKTLKRHMNELKTMVDGNVETFSFFPTAYQELVEAAAPVLHRRKEFMEKIDAALDSPLDITPTEQLLNDLRSWLAEMGDEDEYIQ